MIAPERVVEIGALRGDTTASLLESLGADAQLHVIDPVPQFDPAEHARRFAGRYVFHRDTSLRVLPKLDAVDVALIDGDHNWYITQPGCRCCTLAEGSRGRRVLVLRHLLAVQPGDVVRGMAPGSVVVDLAAERGGNCELTRADQVVVEQGVTILGPTNLPSTVPYHASQMYAKNVSTFLLHLIKDGSVRIDPADEITRDTLIAEKGEVVNSRIRELLGLPGTVQAGR